MLFCRNGWTGRAVSILMEPCGENVLPSNFEMLSIIEARHMIDFEASKGVRGTRIEAELEEKRLCERPAAGKPCSRI